MKRKYFCLTINVPEKGKAKGRWCVVEGGMVRVRRKGREVKGGGVEGALHAYD